MTRRRAAVLGACLFCGLAGAWLGDAWGAPAGAALAALLSAIAAALALGAGDARAVPAAPGAPTLAMKAPAPAGSAAAPAILEPGIPSAFETDRAAPDTVKELETLRVRLGEDLDQVKRLHALALDLKGNLVELASRVATAARQNALLLEGAERDGAQVGVEIQALVGVKEALHQGTAVIDDLARSSREVGPIIESIFVVARKTNMVALNAAIEAARAGEQGRGFAVVAEEVRRLAEAATASTQKVERFVEGLRERTASAIQVLQGAARIEETIPVVYRISDAFASLVPAVESANKSLGELSALVEENVKEVALLREAAEAGMAATTESIARVDALIQGRSLTR